MAIDGASCRARDAKQLANERELNTSLSLLITHCCTSTLFNAAPTIVGRPPSFLTPTLYSSRRRRNDPSEVGRARKIHSDISPILPYFYRGKKTPKSGLIFWHQSPLTACHFKMEERILHLTHTWGASTTDVCPPKVWYSSVPRLWETEVTLPLPAKIYVGKLSCLCLFCRYWAQVEPLNRFWCSMAQTTCFRARRCLFVG